MAPSGLRCVVIQNFREKARFTGWFMIIRRTNQSCLSELPLA